MYLWITREDMDIWEKLTGLYHNGIITIYPGPDPRGISPGKEYYFSYVRQSWVIY